MKTSDWGPRHERNGTKRHARTAGWAPPGKRRGNGNNQKEQVREWRGPADGSSGQNGWRSIASWRRRPARKAKRKDVGGQGLALWISVSAALGTRDEGRDRQKNGERGHPGKKGGFQKHSRAGILTRNGQPSRKITEREGGRGQSGHQSGNLRGGGGACTEPGKRRES